MIKAILVIAFIVMLIAGLVGFIYVQYIWISPTDLDINAVETEEAIVQPENQLSESSDILLESNDEKIRLDYLENPRLRVYNSSGDEVAGIDHNGTIAGEEVIIKNNLTVSDAGFFSKLGDSVSRVVSSFFQQVNINDTTTITANATFGDDDHVCFGDSGCSDSYMVWNGTTLIIKVN